MIRAGTGSSTATNARTAAIEATTAALKQAGLRTADCALIFASTAYGGAYPMIVRSVAEAAGTREVAGCGSIGVIAGGREFESGPALAVMVLAAIPSRRRVSSCRSCADVRGKSRTRSSRRCGRIWARPTCCASFPIPTISIRNR